MSRQINSETDHGSTTNYRDRLLKLIPSEIVAAYITLQGLIQGLGINENKDKLLLVVIGILFLLTPFYLVKVSLVTKKGQIFISTIGFLVWVFTTTNFTAPYDKLFWEIPTAFIASLVFILFTLISPLFYKG